MKIDWNKKYNTIALYSFIVAASVIAFYLAISQIGAFIKRIQGIVEILHPFIFGFAFAYILNFLLKRIEKSLRKIKKLEKVKDTRKRAIALILTYSIAGVVTYLFIAFVLPQLIDSIVALVTDIPKYISQLTELVGKLMKELDIDPEYYNLIMDNINGFIDYIIKIASNLLPVLGKFIADVLSSIWNIVLGIIISIYLLMDKERFFAMFKKIAFAFLSQEHAKRLIKLNEKSNAVFGGFLSGKIIDSTIICVLTFVILKIFNMPYTLLISVIVGITNIIPFFGPFIGAAPSFIIILCISPKKAIIFLILIFIIQQLDGNLIGPKILGNSIGISAFWILFSILVAGKFLGVVGMIIGVPLFAIIYSIIKDIVEERLRAKGLNVDTKDYM